MCPPSRSACGPTYPSKQDSRTVRPTATLSLLPSEGLGEKGVDLLPAVPARSFVVRGVRFPRTVRGSHEAVARRVEVNAFDRLARCLGRLLELAHPAHGNALILFTENAQHRCLERLQTVGRAGRLSITNGAGVNARIVD